MATNTVPDETVAEANSKSVRLRELLHAPEILVLPGAFNVLSALLFQQLGFPAIQGSSAGIANAMGYLDLGISRDQTLRVTGDMAAAVSLPVNADGEDGYGGPDEVRDTVRAFVAAGAAGMNMEDSAREGGGLVPLEQQLEKIAAFMDERKQLGSEFLLNARVDAFARMRDDPEAARSEAIRRGQAYAKAGADSVFFMYVTDPETLRTLVQEIPAPVSILNTPAGPSVPELQEMRVARVSFGSAFLYAAVSGVKRLADELRESGTMTSLEGGITPKAMREIIAGRKTSRDASRAATLDR
jgi:2-methylisocitrate lyase-like PEP mutase family enzyme